MSLKHRLSVLLAAAVLPLAGCGDSGSGSNTGADPAAVVPAGAPLYVEATVRPDGSLKDGAEDALKKLLNTDDPGAKITDLLNQATADESIKWDEVKAWLGPRVGFFFSGVEGGKPVAAAVLDVTDADKAKATLDKVAAQDADQDLETTILGDDYAVIGTADGLAAVKAASGDAAKGLAEAPDFQASRDAVSADENLAFVYLDPQGILDALTSAASALGSDNPLSTQQSLDVLRQLFGKAGRAVAIGLHADGDAVRIEGAGLGAPVGSTSTAAVDSLAALPADAWLAIGFGDIGKTLTDGLQQISQLAAAASPTAPDFSKVLDELEQKVGIDLREDFLSWMGDGALYARGRSIADVGGALTIRTKNPERSNKAVGILAQALAKAGANVRPATVDGYDVAVEVRSAQAPISLFIAANDERFTVGVNPQAMTDVLDPDDKLGDSDSYDKAVDALGGDGIRPLAIIDTPTIVSLLETFGLSEREGYDKVKPYLDALGPISIGTVRDGDVARFAFALGLR